MRKPGIRQYAIVAGFYALALMAKPQVITFPFLLLLWDYWPLGRIDSPDQPDTNRRVQRTQLIIEKVPLLLLSLASAILTMEAQQTGRAVRTLTHYGLPLRLETGVVLLRTLSGQGLLALQTCRNVPAVQPALSCLAGGRVGAHLSGDNHDGRPARAAAALSRGWLVLVPGQSGTYDRVGAGRYAGDG